MKNDTTIHTDLVALSKIARKTLEHGNVVVKRIIIICFYCEAIRGTRSCETILHHLKKKINALQESVHSSNSVNDGAVIKIMELLRLSLVCAFSASRFLHLGIIWSSNHNFTKLWDTNGDSVKADYFIVQSCQSVAMSNR